MSAKLAKLAAGVGTKLAFPDGGLALEILVDVADVLFNKEAATKRNIQMWNLIRDEFKHVERTKANREDIQKAIQLAFAYDRHERDDKKRERYVRLIGNAVKSEEQIQDVTSFVQTIEQLNERDVTVLRVMNAVMNKKGDWKPQPNPGIGDIMKVHPNTFIQRAQELTVQVAMGKGQKTEGNTYSREEGHGICNRLQGFGLAHEIESQTRELPLTNYVFRLSTFSVRLLKLLGDDVPNYEHYTMH